MVTKEDDRRCYVIFPLGGGFQNENNRLYNSILLPILRKRGYDIIRSDELVRQGEITAKIVDYITDADIVIGDLTHYYPTVLYELGIRHAVGRPTILFLKADQPVPTDLLLMLMRTVVYSLRNSSSIGVARQRFDQLMNEMEEQNNRATVFISCNYKDVNVSKILGENLKALGYEVRLYEWDVPPGASFIEFMEESIKKASVMLLLWSKYASTSFWVTEEYRSFHTKISENPLSKLVVIKLDNTSVPPLLNHRRWIDYQNNAKGLDQLIKNVLWGITGNLPYNIRTLPSLQEEIVAKSISNPLPYAFCPRCGSDQLKWDSYSNDEDGIEVATIECEKCGWQDLL